MATLDQWVDSKRWIMQEKGLQAIWNELKQIANSQFGPAANTIIGTVIIDLAAEGATSIKGEATRPHSGVFSAGNTQNGMRTLRPDPGTAGGFGPTPRRQGPAFPATGGTTIPQLDGFRTNSGVTPQQG